MTYREAPVTKKLSTGLNNMQPTVKTHSFLLIKVVYKWQISTTSLQIERLIVLQISWKRKSVYRQIYDGIEQLG